MRCLWLTYIDPRPEHSGQLIYSGRLIGALAEAGAEIEVLCLARRESERDDGDFEEGVRWHVVPEERRPAWASVFSELPNVAFRAGAAGVRRRFAALLRDKRWDCVFLDGLFVSWGLAALLREARRHDPDARPRLVYVSHNHEETTRARVAQNYRGNPLERTLLTLDARKARWLERRVVESADLVTAITPEDAARYAVRRGKRPTLVLLPGYCGRRLAIRRITRDMPRRAIVVGSFDWLAKRMNLEEFLHVADPLFAAAGAELEVIGDGDARFLDRLRREVSTAHVTGAVECILPYLDSARIAIVPERTGGGFKLKVLDYVFNRLPVAAIENSVAGMPLEPNRSILTFPHYQALVPGVLAAMDDLDLLNGLQERAFDVCDDLFDWRSRGRALMDAARAA